MLQKICLTLILILSFTFCSQAQIESSKEPIPPFFQKILAAAHERTLQKVTYDGKYLKIKYPMGDVPNDTGVCTDVVIRSYRKLGIDLQKEVHKDNETKFSSVS